MILVPQDTRNGTITVHFVPWLVGADFESTTTVIRDAMLVVDPYDAKKDLETSYLRATSPIALSSAPIKS